MLHKAWVSQCGWELWQGSASCRMEALRWNPRVKVETSTPDTDFGLHSPLSVTWGGADISSVTHSRVRLSVSQRSAWLIPYEALTRGASGSAPLQEEEPRWSKAPQVLLHHVSRDSWGLWHLRHDWVPKRLLAPVLLVTRAQGSQTGYFLNSFGITQKIRLCKATRIE